MSEDTSGPAVDAAPAPVATPAPEIQREFSPSDAARMLAARRAELRAKPPEEPAAPTAPEPRAQELAPEADTGPETVPSETQADDPAEAPPINPPRSWTNEEKEAFKAYPRDAQERISAQVARQEAAFLRSQNEAAEVRKAAEAELTQAKQARQQYEAKQAAYTQTLEEALQNEFSDIKSMNDVRKMQLEDPFRFQGWQLRQMELSSAQSEKQALEQSKAQEQQTKRASYEAEQNKLLVELVPEMADPNKAIDLRQRAVKMLNEDLGLSNDTLGRWMQSDAGHEILSNAGIQKLIADGLKYREIKSAPKAVPQGLPPVQRPGASKVVSNGNAGKIQALEKQLNNQSGYNQAKIMAEIRMLRRAR